MHIYTSVTFIWSIFSALQRQNQLANARLFLILPKKRKLLYTQHAIVLHVSLCMYVRTYVCVAYVEYEVWCSSVTRSSIPSLPSTRKRMSVIVRLPDGRIKLYCKGAVS